MEHRSPFKKTKYAETVISPRHIEPEGEIPYGEKEVRGRDTLRNSGVRHVNEEATLEVDTLTSSPQLVLYDLEMNIPVLRNFFYVGTDN